MSNNLDAIDNEKATGESLVKKLNVFTSPDHLHTNKEKNLVRKILDDHMKLLKFSRSPLSSRDLRAITHRIGLP